MDWDELGGTGRDWSPTRPPVWVTGMNWDELGWTGMNWDGHRSHCGVSENLKVAPGGLWVILGWTGMNWGGLEPLQDTSMGYWDELG